MACPAGMASAHRGRRSFGEPVISCAGSPHARFEVSMGARLTAALLAGRAAAGLSRRFGLGGGTVISGHVVPRIAPDALSTIARRLPLGSVLVSGTNGKTTSARLVSHLLRGSDLRPLHNRAGANLLTGLVSA